MIDKSITIAGFLAENPASISLDPTQAHSIVSEDFVLTHRLEQVAGENNRIIQRQASCTVTIPTLSGSYISTLTLIIRNLREYDACLGADWLGDCRVRVNDAVVLDPVLEDTLALSSANVWLKGDANPAIAKSLARRLKPLPAVSAPEKVNQPTAGEYSHAYGMHVINFSIVPIADSAASQSSTPSQNVNFIFVQRGARTTDSPTRSSHDNESRITKASRPDDAVDGTFQRVITNLEQLMNQRETEHVRDLPSSTQDASTSQPSESTAHLNLANASFSKVFCDTPPTNSIADCWYQCSAWIADRATQDVSRLPIRIIPVRFDRLQPPPGGGLDKPGKRLIQFIRVAFHDTTDYAREFQFLIHLRNH